MPPCPVGTPDPVVLVTYDNTKGTERLSKRFDNPRKARAFWLSMFRANRNPHYRNPNKEPQT